jgi:hypothetical protein
MIRKTNFFRLIVLLIPVFGSCTSATDSSTSGEDIITELYRNEMPDIIEFVRFIKAGTKISMLYGTISYTPGGLTRQDIRHKRKIDATAVESESDSLFNKGFRKEFDLFRKVLFIQVADVVVDGMEMINYRHKLENILDSELMKQGLGEWFAGDMGSGGANMLYFVNDWDLAYRAALRVLNEEDLTQQVIIAKRLTLAHGFWNYTVIFPCDFSGEFNSM